MPTHESPSFEVVQTTPKIDWTCQQQIFEKVDVLSVVGPFFCPGRFSRPIASKLRTHLLPGPAERD